jgi:IS30 family transposase
MGIRGRKRRLEIEDEYWRLILGGIGTVDACRRIGIGRKTGYRWRAELGGVPPTRVADGVRGKRYLSLFERQRIATLRGQGIGVREIARRLDRSPSTISRELCRNVAEHDGGIYDSDLAHVRACQRATRRRTARLAADEDLRHVVQDKLDLEWSPEQISGWLRRTHPDQPSWHLCHETIYQAVYNPRRRPEQALHEEAAHRETAAKAQATVRRASGAVHRTGPPDRRAA